VSGGSSPGRDLEDRRAGVVIVNDSSVARAVLAAVIQADGGFDLLGQANGGLAGVEMVCRLRPRLVLLDLHMPDIDGVEVTRRIMRRCPTRILIASATIRRNTTYLFEALKQGALDYARTPSLQARPGERVTPAALLEAGATLLRKMRTVLGLRPAGDPRALPPRTGGSQSSTSAGASHVGAPRTLATEMGRETGPIRVVAVGSSTGGPTALATLFAAIPRGLSAIYLISQHIDPEFSDGLALWLAQETGHPVAVARDGEIPIPGHVYLAMGGRRNLLLSPSGRLQYESAGDAVYCPNIDRLFESVAASVPPRASRPDAEHRGAPVCGVVLTGLGDDGTEGLARIKAAGGRVLVQDPATAVVDGMPGAPIRRGILSHGHSLPDLARWVAHWIGTGG
jgi:chemotaxis response regulator CheB